MSTPGWFNCPCGSGPERCPDADGRLLCDPLELLGAPSERAATGRPSWMPEPPPELRERYHSPAAELEAPGEWCCPNCGECHPPNRWARRAEDHPKE